MTEKKNPSQKKVAKKVAKKVSKKAAPKRQNAKPSEKAKARAKKFAGQPKIPFCQDTADFICTEIATSSKSISRICKENPELPSDRTINTWMWREPAFFQQYLVAKERQQIFMIEETEGMLENVLYYVDAQGNKRIDAPSMAMQQAKANLRKWHASKMMPKVYGDKTVIETHNKQDDEMKEKLLKLQKENEEKYKKDY